MDKHLIYKEDALEIVRRTSGDNAAAFSEISRRPAGDAVQGTRCRDCDGRRVEVSSRGIFVNCGFCSASNLVMPNDGFCSLGKGGR